jgi:hypothetical protein
VLKLDVTNLVETVEAIEEGEEARVRRLFDINFFGLTRLIAVEGLSEALWQEVGPLGIHVMLVESSGFRTDRADRAQLRASSGKQSGDPVRAAGAVIVAVKSTHSPHRLLLVAAAYDGAISKLDEMRVEFREWEAVARAADFDRNGNSPVVAARP